MCGVIIESSLTNNKPEHMRWETVAILSKHPRMICELSAAQTCCFRASNVLTSKKDQGVSHLTNPYHCSYSHAHTSWPSTGDNTLCEATEGETMPCSRKCAMIAYHAAPCVHGSLQATEHMDDADMQQPGHVYVRYQGTQASTDIAVTRTVERAG